MGGPKKFGNFEDDIYEISMIKDSTVDRGSYGNNDIDESFNLDLLKRLENIEIADQ